MSLLQLPPETLRQIFDQVGSSFFREDLNRLTVCKQWSEYALPAFLKCIPLSQETLRFPGGGLLQLKADIQQQAEALATRMTSPKIIRVLTHSLPQFETQSLDVLTGKTMKLDGAMAWDEDGTSVEDDSEPESELLDDDFSAFSDE